MRTQESTAPILDLLVELLVEKNHYLEKFQEMNAAELARFSVGNFDHIQSFYENREQVLEIIRLIDQLVDEKVQLIEQSHIDVDARTQIGVLMTEKDARAKEIISQDLQILAEIEREKTKIIRELQTTSQVKKAVGKYAGQSVQSRQFDVHSSDD